MVKREPPFIPPLVSVVTGVRWNKDNTGTTSIENISNISYGEPTVYP